MRIVRYTVIVLLTLSVLVLLYQFLSALMLFALALSTAAAIRPGVDLLARLRLPRGAAVLLTYLVVVSLLVGFFLAIGGPLLHDVEVLTDDATSAYERMKSTWPQGNAFQQAVAGQLPDPQVLYQSLTGGVGLRIVQGALGFASGLFGLFGSLVIVVVLSLYWSLGRVRFERRWLALLAVRYRGRTRDIWRQVESCVGATLGNQLVQAYVAAVVLWLAYALLGLRYPALVGLWGAVAPLIPWVGPVLGIATAVLVALPNGPLITVATGVLTIGVLTVLYLFVRPRFRCDPRSSSLLLAVVAIVLFELSGVFGLVLAPPLAIALQITFGRLVQPPAAVAVPEPQPGLRELRERLERLRARTAEQEPSPEMTSLLQRLEALLRAVDAYYTT